MNGTPSKKSTSNADIQGVCVVLKWSWRIRKSNIDSVEMGTRFLTGAASPAN